MIPNELLGLLESEERKGVGHAAYCLKHWDECSRKQEHDASMYLLQTLASVLGRLRDTSADLVGARLELRRSEQRWSDAAEDITSMDNYRVKAELRAERAEAERDELRKELAEERRLRVEAEDEVFRHHAWTDAENCGHPASEGCWVPAGVWGPRGDHSGNDDKAYLSEYACDPCKRTFARRTGEGGGMRYMPPCGHCEGSGEDPGSDPLCVPERCPACDGKGYR